MTTPKPLTGDQANANSEHRFTIVLWVLGGVAVVAVVASVGSFIVAQKSKDISNAVRGAVCAQVAYLSDQLNEAVATGDMVRVKRLRDLSGRLTNAVGSCR